MSIVTDLASGACLLAGAVFSVLGGVGLIRMPDCYTRMHAASVTETLGTGLLLFGLLLQAGVGLVAAKIVMLGLIVFFTSPTASHALARAVFTYESRDAAEPGRVDSSLR